MRKALAVGTAATLLGLGLAAAPASADTTTVTFALTAGAIAIDAPATANLGAVGASTAATVVTGQLGSTVVTDTRGSLLGAYQVTLSSGDFTTGSAGVNETVLGATVTGMSGPVTHTNGTLTKVATETLVPVASGLPILGLSAYSGNDTATFNPTVSITVPATNAAGVYTGVITQTVVGL